VNWILSAKTYSLYLYSVAHVFAANIPVLCKKGALQKMLFSKTVDNSVQNELLNAHIGAVADSEWITLNVSLLLKLSAISKMYEIQSGL